MRTTTVVDGVEIPFQARGDGPGLMLVHGTGPGGEIAFGHLIDRFAESFRVVMPDLSGSPTVDDNDVPLTVELLANQVRGVADAAGLHEFVIVGFSLGGPVAVALAALAAERVRGLIVAAGWLKTADDPYLSLLYNLWERTASDAGTFGRFSTLTGFSPEYLSTLSTDDVAALSANLAPNRHVMRQIHLGEQVDVSAYASLVTAPSLFIAGRHDATIPPHAVMKLANAVRGSRTLMVDSGHVMTFEKPTEFIENVRTFAEESCQRTVTV